MPLIATKGAASAQGFGEFAQTAAPVYIEDVFSTYLYTGNGSTQTITNGIDLSTKGGLVWFKGRTGTINHSLYDTARGRAYTLSTNNTTAQGGPSSSTEDLTSFNSNGFSLGTPNYSPANNNGLSAVSWTFRKAEKFFDVVTYTGNGTTQTINHNLGSTPGTIIVKLTSSAGSNWAVWHRGNGTTPYFLLLDTTDSNFTSTYNASTAFLVSAPTSTSFVVKNASFDAAIANGNGATYVAYLFAHNAGGFGLTGSDNVITCGSYTTDGSGNATVSLGYEPQWLLVKPSSTTGNWNIIDNMRGMPVANATTFLQPNTTQADTTYTAGSIRPTATGFTENNYWGANTTVIYIAIRRGPMKTPTTGTTVFTPDAAGNNASAGGLAFDAGFPVDWYVRGEKSGSNKFYGFTRLTGDQYLETTSTAAGAASAYADQFDSMTGIETTTGFDFSGQCAWLFRRAPGFFDVVCYTGDGTATRTVNHNLGVAPELIIGKIRSTTGNWLTYTPSGNIRMALNSTSASPVYGGAFAGTTPTSTTFSFDIDINVNGATYVNYLFASVSGVSKVGSYTGTGGLQTINCGFTTGARFVLIKRTDSTGDWWVYDSARGISSGNDPYLFLNSTAAEVTNTNYVDTTSVGFQVTAAAPAGLNANGGSYIFLAVA